MTQDQLIEAVNGLSSDACYLASSAWFRTVMMGKPILAKVDNDRQQAAFDELLAVGFVHADVERGIPGYRSTDWGRQASPICAAALAGPPA